MDVGESHQRPSLGAGTILLLLPREDGVGIDVNIAVEGGAVP